MAALTRASPYVDEDVIPRYPKNLLQDRSYLQANGVLDRSYMAGTTNDEGSMFLPASFAQIIATQKNLELQILYATKGMFPLTNNDAIKSQVEFLYSYPREADGRPPFQGMVDLQSDSLLVFPSVEFVTMLSEVSPSTPICQYLFDYYPEVTLEDGSISREKGTTHAYDLAFMFDSLTWTPDLVLDTADARTMKDVYRGTLAQFAKTGNPSRPGIGESPSVWPRFDSAGRQYMALSATPEARSRVFAKRMSLWQDYLPLIANNIFTGRQRNRF